MLDYFFGPIGRDNCVVFQLVSMISFVMVIVLLLIGIMSAKKNKSYLAIIGVITSPLAMYYIYRLLYSMCLGAL